MKTIKIAKEVKYKLDEYADGQSINNAMRKLLANAEEFPQDNLPTNQKLININIDDDLFYKLKKCKKYSNETHAETILRLLEENQNR